MVAKPRVLIFDPDRFESSLLNYFNLSVQFIIIYKKKIQENIYGIKYLNISLKLENIKVENA